MGQLGLGEDMVEQKKPHPVGGALEGCIITQVICGGMHTVALSKEGKVRGYYYTNQDTFGTNGGVPIGEVSRFQGFNCTCTPVGMSVFGGFIAPAQPVTGGFE